MMDVDVDASVDAEARADAADGPEPPRPLLPAALLASLSDQRPLTPEPADTGAGRTGGTGLAGARARSGRVRKLTSSLSGAGRCPDLELGNGTRVRVLAGAGEKRLAPAWSVDAKSGGRALREDWLRGRGEMGRNSKTTKNGKETKKGVVEGRMRRRDWGGVVRLG